MNKGGGSGAVADWCGHGSVSFPDKNEKACRLAGLFLASETSMAGSSIYILIFGNLFSLCFVWVAAISVENALDKFFAGCLLRSKHSFRDQGHRDWALLTEEAAEKVPDEVSYVRRPRSM